MDEYLKESIRKTMDKKSTEKLRNIYSKHSLSQWSPETFEVIREILTNRGDNVIKYPVETLEVNHFRESRLTDQDKFPVLHLVVVGYYILALFSAILTLVGIIALLRHPPMQSFEFFMIIGGIVGLLAFVLLAEQIRVFLDIEKNTRLTAIYLIKLSDRGMPESKETKND